MYGVDFLFCSQSIERRQLLWLISILCITNLVCHAKPQLTVHYNSGLIAFIDTSHLRLNKIPTFLSVCFSCVGADLPMSEFCQIRTCRYLICEFYSGNCYPKTLLLRWSCYHVIAVLKFLSSAKIRRDNFSVKPQASQW